MMTSTLHLSPTRASTEATARQLPSACGPGGMAGTFVVLGSHGCARVSKMCVLAGFCHGHSYSASYKPIPKVTQNETPAHQLQRSRPPLRQPPGFRRHRRTAAPGHAGPRHQLSRPHADAAGASLRARTSPPARALRRRPACSRHRRRPGGAGRVSGRRHRRARRAHVQFYNSKPAQGLDRPHPGRGQDVQILARKASKAWPATSASSSRFRAAAFTARARRPRSASTWKPICAGCSASSASQIRNSFPPTASRSAPNIVKKPWLVR